MSAWTDLSLSSSVLDGMAHVDLASEAYETVDSDRITTNLVTAAKRYIESRMMNQMPELVALVEGPDVFMTAVVGISNLSNQIQEVLGRAFLMQYYAQERFTSADLYMVKMGEAREMFDMAFSGLTKYLQADEDFITALESSSSENLDKYDDPVFIG